MKISNLTNFERSLKKTRENLLLTIKRIDYQLLQIKLIKTHNECHCPQCFSRDLRLMKDKKIFCRACGYTNKKNNEARK